MVGKKLCRTFCQNARVQYCCIFYRCEFLLGLLKVDVIHRGANPSQRLDVLSVGRRPFTDPPWKDLTHVAVTCNHTSQFTKAVVCGALTDLDHLATDGKFSYEKVGPQSMRITFEITYCIPIGISGAPGTHVSKTSFIFESIPR